MEHIDSRPSHEFKEVKPQHTPTPTPWCFYKNTIDYVSLQDQIHIGSMAKSEDAAFIVRAVNCHEELLATAQTLISELRWTSKNGQFPGMDKVIEDASKAIARAEGK